MHKMPNDTIRLFFHLKPLELSTTLKVQIFAGAKFRGTTVKTTTYTKIRYRSFN